MAARYERVRFLDGSRVRTALLRVESDGVRFLRGVEVDREGDEVTGPAFDVRVRIIDKAVVKSRRVLAIDPKYGTLEPASRKGGVR